MGKTTAVLSLQGIVDAVIYADASVCYKDLDLGVAKPSLAEQQAIPHHMIDILTMEQTLNVVDFMQQSDAIIADLAMKQQVPLVTGGTLFYIKNFLYGMPKTPPVQMQTRAYVARLLQEQGSEALHRQLQAVDAISAKRIAVQDSYRITRALEVYYDSGKPLSSFAIEKDALRDAYDFLIIELVRPREELYERINNRVEQMWQAGLTDEVRALQAKGLTSELPASRAIGYREFFEANLSEVEIKELIKKNTRNYAKRQLTFLRSLPIQHRLPADDNEALRAIILAFLGKCNY